MDDRIRRWSIVVGVVCVLLLASQPALQAAQKPQLRLHSLFTDHAVLQSGTKVPVWGQTAPGAEITVSVAGVHSSVTANAEGQWQAALPAVKAGGPHTLVVRKDGGETVRCEDVMFGEVWLASGQSNMVWLLRNTDNGKQAIDAADNPKIRFFQVQRKPTDRPVDQAPGGPWKVSSPDTAPVFSATAYYFADYLQKQLNVPVGIIQSAEGGSRVQAWIRRQEFEKNPELEADLRELQELNRNHDSLVKAQNPRKTPTVYYNGMIAPLLPYSIRGAIWYQGEANAKPGDSERYEEALSTLIRQWRSQWGHDFPFLFVQLPEFRGRGDDWVRVQNEQRLTYEHVKNTAVIVTLGLGNPENIHPRHKRPVGQRLARAALVKAYGRDLTWSGPLVKEAAKRGSKAVISFNHVDDGLVIEGDSLEGFELTGDGENWVEARARIDGDHVVVDAAGISSPVAVRYAWSDVPDANLSNKEGLPASPFSIEVVQ